MSLEWPSDKGGLQAQVMSYYADFYAIFGLTPITIWDLPAGEFFAMTIHVDKERAKAKRERDQAK